MKRVKMIVTSVVVLAIVGSAFAFNAKKIGKFCVTTNLTTSGNCITVSPSKRTTSSGTEYLYYTNWDGASGSCNSTAPCDTRVTIVQD
jgi:uncharacterized protein YxeA